MFRVICSFFSEEQLERFNNSSKQRFFFSYKLKFCHLHSIIFLGLCLFLLSCHVWKVGGVNESYKFEEKVTLDIVNGARIII